MITKYSKFSYCLMFFLLICSNSVAFENQSKIISIINGIPITTFDLNERLNIFLTESNLDKSSDNKIKFKDTVINTLIEEELKFQEAQRINPSLISRAEEKAENLLQLNFGPEREKIEKNLKTFGASYQHFLRLFTADVIWSSIIKSKYEKQFIKIEEEVKSRLKELELNFQEPHFKLSEIIITKKNNMNNEKSSLLIKNIIQSINNGANFHSLAKQFSSSESRKNSGRLGWIQKERITSEYLEIIETLKVGQISKPIETEDSFTVLKLEGKIINGQRDELETILELVKLLYPLDSSNEDDIEKAKIKLKKDLMIINDCNKFRALHINYGNKNIAESGKFQIYNLNRKIKNEVLFLQKNEKSEPIVTKDGLISLMVCDRYLPDIELRAKDDIKRELEGKLFVKLSDRYINRLKRTSYIEKLD